MNKKIIYISTIVILSLAALGLCFYFYIQNNKTNEVVDPTVQIDTSDWKTYTNKEYGFSFKYPGGWELDNNCGGIYGGMLNFDRQICVIINRPIDMFIPTVTFAITKDSLKDLVFEIEESSKDITGLVLTEVGEISDINIKGIPVKRGTHGSASSIGQVFYYLFLENGNYLYIYHTELGRLNGVDHEMTQIYNNIISSIEIIK